MTASACPANFATAYVLAIPITFIPPARAD